MLLLKSLTLNNFLSYENQTIAFDRSQKILLDGNSGGGKSTILEAIIWTLYGQGRADNKSLIHKGASKASVVLTLEDVREDGVDTYTIQRSVSHEGRQQLQVLVGKNGEPAISHEFTGLRELQAWIERDLIGASYILFVNSIAYLQNGSNTFVTQTAPKRKELLLEIVNAIDFDDYYDRTKKKLQEVELKIASAEGEIKSVDLWLQAAEEQITDKEKVVKELDGAKVMTQVFKDQWERAVTKEASFKGVEGAIAAAEGIVRELESSKASLQSQLNASQAASVQLKHIEIAGVELAGIKEKLTPIDGEIVVLEETVLNEATKQQKRSAMMMVKPTVTVSEEQIKKHAAMKDMHSSRSVCPSGELCPHEKDNRTILTRFEKEVTEMREKRALELQQLATWQAGYDALPLSADLTSTLASLNGLKAQRTQLKDRSTSLEILIGQRGAKELIASEEPLLTLALSEKEKDLAAATVQVAQVRLSLNPEELANAKKEVATAHAGMLAQQQVETTLSSRLEYLSKLESSLSDHRARKVTLEGGIKESRAVMEQLELLKEAFGSKGIKTIIIDYLIPNLEDKINNVLQQMSDFRVNLNTRRMKADGEGLTEGLFITIVNGEGQEMDFENYSGGERLKIVVAISEALASLKDKVGFRLFDEVFVGLDENSTESFASVLERLQANFEQILCISHLQQVKDTFEQSILVTKVGGKSHLTFNYGEGS